MRPINPFNNNGSIQLKFSYGGKRYSFNPVPGGDYGNKRDIQTANAIGTRITNDILAGNFDPSLDRYRLVPKAPPPVTKLTPRSLLELWDLWVMSLGLSEATKANHHNWVRRMIWKAAPQSLADTQWFKDASVSASTYNKRLSYLRSFGKWAVRQGYLETNPYEPLKPRKGNRATPKPFTAQEIQDILQGFDQMAPSYAGFVRFLLMTGVRTGEAIGLTWSHIDFAQGTLTISESLSIDRTGNGYTRVRKETKNASVRVLGLSNPLRDLLLAIQPPDVSPDALVFQRPNGSHICSRNFRLRYWKPVLLAAGVPYRKPYNTRHTMISHAIEQGIPITGVAYMAGHRDTRMVLTTYGHMVNRPELPRIL